MLIHATMLAKPHTPPSALLATSSDFHLPKVSEIHCTPFQQPSPAKSTLLTKLKGVISTLPDCVPIGTREDNLAQFSGDPIHKVDDGEDMWEMIDWALNCVIGLGKMVREIEDIIQKGQYRMDGMLLWLKKCIYEPHRIVSKYRT